MKWFKFWTSAPADFLAQGLSMEQIGRWAMLGALTAQIGGNGTLEVDESFLMGYLKFPTIEDMQEGLKVYRNLSVKNSAKCNGKIIVTFHKWAKYQVDTTGYERQKKHRKVQKCNGNPSLLEVDSKGVVSKDSKSLLYKEIIEHLNNILGTRYTYNNKNTIRLIDARFKQKHTINDFKTVHEKMAREWKGTEFEKFLRPETLYGTKFEGYLNRKEVAPQAPKLSDAERDMLIKQKRGHQENADRIKGQLEFYEGAELKERERAITYHEAEIAKINNQLGEG